MMICDAGRRSETLIVLKAHTFASLGLLEFFHFFIVYSCPNSPGATPMELLKPQEMLAMQSRVQARFKVQRTCTSTVVIL